MPKNKMIDLHNHLFARLEALGDESLKGEELQAELDRSKATASIADKVIQNAGLVLQVDKHLAEHDSRKAGQALKDLLPAAPSDEKSR